MKLVHRTAVALALVFAFTLSAKDARREMVVNLKFVPQESVQTTSPDLPQDLLDRGFELRLEDSRRLSDKAMIGEGTNDDDQTFPIRAGTDLIAYVNESLKGVSTAWALKDGRDRVLTIAVSRFFVNESNKPLGSMYSAEVKLSYVLTSADGITLAKGIGSGEARRYGRSRSPDNCNEVLSDALKGAYAEVLGDTALHTAWISGKPAAGSASSSAEPKETPEERLKKLEDLYKKGLITKEEYERKRAEILKEL